jgi:hypothetical protein
LNTDPVVSTLTPDTVPVDADEYAGLRHALGEPVDHDASNSTDEGLVAALDAAAAKGPDQVGVERDGRE